MTNTPLIETSDTNQIVVPDESRLGEGGFGCVFKGWIEENGTAPVKPGTGLTVAVETLNHDGLQGHKEWLACSLCERLDAKTVKWYTVLTRVRYDECKVLFQLN
ncbi:putative non-specific serine/threonine protein kinase [Helianthus annuus]|nr:putative non-specific serine/threonine protein kinase [Helianthus annuus]